MSAPLSSWSRRRAPAAAGVGDLVDLAGAGGPARGVGAPAAGRRARSTSATARAGAGGRVVERVDRARPLRVAGRERIDQRRRRSPVIVVVQALPKGERGETAVETLTEVGVDVIVPWAAERCVAAGRGERAASGPREWAATAREPRASRRAGRGCPRSAALADTVDGATRCVAAAVARVVLHEEADAPLPASRCPPTGTSCSSSGPRAGSARRELAGFAAAGARARAAGPHGAAHLDRRHRGRGRASLAAHAGAGPDPSARSARAAVATEPMARLPVLRDRRRRGSPRRSCRRDRHARSPSATSRRRRRRTCWSIPQGAPSTTSTTLVAADPEARRASVLDRCSARSAVARGADRRLPAGRQHRRRTAARPVGHVHAHVLGGRAHCVAARAERGGRTLETS